MDHVLVMINMKEFLLSQESFTVILKALYRTNEMKADHDTEWTDEFDVDIVREKLLEIIKCDEHPVCRAIAALIKKKDTLP